MSICRQCKLFDIEGKGCVIPGTQPCCNENLGGCGCKLSLKTRSLSSNCPLDRWNSVMTEEEEDLLREKLMLPNED